MHFNILILKWFWGNAAPNILISKWFGGKAVQYIWWKDRHHQIVPFIPSYGGGGEGCFSFGGTVQYIEESNIYLCFVACRLKMKREDWLLDRIRESKKDCWDSIRRTSYPYQ